MCRAWRVISDAVRERYAPCLPGRVPGDWGDSAPKNDNRTVLEAALRIAHTGAAWRDPPTGFGNRNSIYQRLRRWCRGGVFQGDWFAKLAADLGLDPETLLVDRTFVKVHHPGTVPPEEDARLFRRILTELADY